MSMSHLCGGYHLTTHWERIIKGNEEGFEVPRSYPDTTHKQKIIRGNEEGFEVPRSYPDTTHKQRIIRGNEEGFEVPRSYPDTTHKQRIIRGNEEGFEVPRSYPEATHEQKIIKGNEEGFELPRTYPDVMKFVFKYIDDLFTRAQFSAVCRSWRWIAQRCCPPTTIPWLVLSSDYERDDRIYFSTLSDGQTHTLLLPEARESLCCGSYEGWLIIQTWKKRKRQKLFIIDPLLKTRFELPTVTRDYWKHPLAQPQERMPKILMAVMSAAPVSEDGFINPNCMVAAVDSVGHLNMCRLSDDCSWTRAHFNVPKPFIYKQILFHNGSLVALLVSAGNKIMVVEFDHHYEPKFIAGVLFFQNLKFTARRVKIFEYNEASSLVEWRGELYMVFSRNQWGKGDTMTFRVCKLDSNWNLVKVKNLGDGMIFFLVNGHPKYISVNDIPATLNLKGNRIYFLEKSTSISTTKAFCLGDEKWEPCTSLSFKRIPLMWYAPTLHY